MRKDFRQFILRGNVVDLAVGFIIGAAFTTVVKVLVAHLLTPIISIPGKVNFSNLSAHVNHSVVHYGDLLNALIAFGLAGAALFFLVVRSTEAQRAISTAGKAMRSPSART